MKWYDCDIAAYWVLTMGCLFRCDTCVLRCQVLVWWCECIQSFPALYIADLSKANATKAWVSVMIVEYPTLFDAAAWSVASPALIDVWPKWEVAYAFGTATSRATHRPRDKKAWMWVMRLSHFSWEAEILLRHRVLLCSSRYKDDVV